MGIFTRSQCQGSLCSHEGDHGVGQQGKNPRTCTVTIGKQGYFKGIGCRAGSSTNIIQIDVVSSQRRDQPVVVQSACRIYADNGPRILVSWRRGPISWIPAIVTFAGFRVGQTGYLIDPEDVVAQPRIVLLFQAVHHHHTDIAVSGWGIPCRVPRMSGVWGGIGAKLESEILAVVRNQGSTIDQRHNCLTGSLRIYQAGLEM